MTQPILIEELRITPTTLLANLKAACKKWNLSHPNQEKKETVKDFAINILSYWDQCAFSEWKPCELASYIADLEIKGCVGYDSKSVDQIIAECFERGVVHDYVEEGKTLAALLADHPWILYQG